MIKNTLLAFGLIFFFSISSMGSYENTTAVGVEEEAIDYTSALSYRISTDTADQSDQNLLNQGIFYRGTYFFSKRKYYLAGGLGASFQSVDNELVQNDNGIFEMTDFSLTFGTSAWNLYRGVKDSLSLFTSINNVVPLSERSRNEGYKSVPTIAADLAYRRGPMDFVLSGRYTYVFNEFDSRVDGRTNLETAATTAIAVRYNMKHFRFQYGYRVGLLNYLDGTTIGSSGNSFSITGIINNSLWAAVSTSNINNVEDQFVDVWFYDPFERIYRLSMGVTF